MNAMPKCLKKIVIFGAMLFAVLISASAFFLMYKHDISGLDIHPRINGTMQLLVVPYFGPTDPSWNVIYDEATEYPGTIGYVIINPCSGPCGEQMGQDWDGVISNLRDRGVKTLGYVFNTSENFSNIDYYMKNHAIATDGIFFDNEGSINDIENFKKYSDYVHNLDGIVYTNPGYNYTYVDNYVLSGAADVVNIHELGLADSGQIGQNKAIPPWKSSVIVGNVTDYRQMEMELADIANKGIGISYVYEDSYGKLPDYFPNEVEAAASVKVRQ